MTSIQSLEIKNFQRVSAVKIEPTNNVIMLMGKNAEGKTSVLDAIETTFTGFNSRVTKRPIKDGTGKADIQITLTDGTKLHRKFTPSGTTLAGTDNQGKKLGQKDLDAALSALGVDAYAFIQSGEKKQLETLLSIVELPFVPADLAAERKQLEEERTAIGRQGKAIGNVTIDETLPAAEQPASALISQLQHIATSNAEIDRANLDAAGRASTARREQAALDALLNQVENAKANLAGALKDKEEAEKYAADLGAKQDTTEIEDALEGVEDVNAKVRANNAARLALAQKESLRASYEAHTAQLTAIDKRKADGLAAAVMPVEGLSFDDEGVLYQGVPFSRASGAEQVIVSAAMIIATNPAVRTMVIRNGNVMDEQSLATLQAMCEANDFQAFVEFVSDSEDHEFRIVNGELA